MSFFFSSLRLNSNFNIVDILTPTSQKKKKKYYIGHLLLFDNCHHFVQGDAGVYHTIHGKNIIEENQV